jgi:hypothetical protein
MLRLSPNLELGTTSNAASAQRYRQLPAVLLSAFPLLFLILLLVLRVAMPIDARSDPFSLGMSCVGR